MPPSVSRAARLGLALGAILLVEGNAGRLAAQTIPDTPVAAGFDLYLEVLIDGVPSGLIAAFTRDADGTFAIRPVDLQAVGLVADPAALRPDGRVDISRLPGVTFVYDDALQTMNFSVVMAARAEHVVDAAVVAEAPPPADTAFAAILNYSLSLRYDGAGLALAGTLSPRLSGKFGTIDAQFLFDPANDRRFVRLDTTYTFSNVDRLTTFRLGDVITGGLSWTRPTRLGGFQMTRNFGLRADLVTFPVPEFTGTAAVPSTVDIFLNNAARLSEQVPTGPFVISNLPVMTGAGTARMIVRDANGEETVTETPYYASPILLRPGLLDFSLEVGFPRLAYGEDSFAYAPRLMASASARWGLTDGLTLEGHAEGGAGLLNAGLGLAVQVGHVGLVSVAASASRTATGTGVQVAGTAEFTLGPVRFNASTLRTFGAYEDIPSFTAVCGGTPCDAAPLARDQLSLGIPVLGDRASLGLSFTNLVVRDQDPYRLLGLSLSTQLGQSGSFYVSAFADAGNWDEFGVYAGISIPLGRAIRSTVGVEQSADGLQVATVIANSRANDGGLAWTVRDVEGVNARRSADFSYDASFARLNAGFGWGGEGLFANAGIAGSVVFAGGGFFFADQITDGFAVVDVGVPGVDVFFENRPAGTTNGAGRILLTDLRPYRENRITIDPTNLPLTATVDRTEMLVVPGQGGGTVAEFVVDEGETAALLTLRDAGGAFIEVGAQATIEGSTASFIVGYDGLAYVTGLGVTNRLLVLLPDGSRCSADFLFTASAGTQVALDAVCRPVVQ